MTDDPPTGPRRAAASGSATEDLLVEATLRCLGRAGVAGATARTITAEAGVNLAAITYHFGSKDHLVDRALVRSVRRLLDPVVACLEERRGGASVAAALDLVEQLATAGGPACALYAEAAARAAHSDAVRRGWTEAHDALRAGFGDHEAAGVLVAAIIGTFTGASAGTPPAPGTLTAAAG
jgi:AcrR family transcriptional regulator